MTWGALALALTLLGGGYTWWAWRNRGAAAATRGAGVTLLVPAAWLTGTLAMFGRIADAITDWATRLVFSPSVWAGAILAGLAVVLFVVSGFMRSRGLGGAAKPAKKNKQDARAEAPRQAGQLPPASGRGEPAIDDDLADIEALLRKRGIT